MDQDPMVVPPADGVTPGDNRSYPNRGVSTGVTDTYGADLGGLNRQGSIASATGSDPMDQCCADDQRQTMGSNTPEGSGGRRMRGTGSDTPEDDTPDDQRGLGPADADD